MFAPALIHPRYRRATLSTLVATGVLSAAWAMPAFASDLLDLPLDALLEVEIHAAGKREEQIRDIPASVTMVTREDIARQGWRTLEEVLRHVPGFYLLDNIEERFIGTRGAVGGGVQFTVNGIAQHPSHQKTLTVPEIARLNIPVEAIDRIEIIRGPMSVIYGNNAFLGVVNIVTDEIALAGPRASVSLGTHRNREVFVRLGDRIGDTRGGDFWLLNAGFRDDLGLTGDYAAMFGDEAGSRLLPRVHRDMDGDMTQRDGSLEFIGAWRDLRADLRWTRRDYGLYAFTPAFDDGTRVRLDTLHASLGWRHRFSDRLGLRILATHSEERYHAYRIDFLSPSVRGEQRQGSRRGELELTLHWQPSDRIDALFGYRLLHVDGVDNRPDIDPIIDEHVSLSPYTTNDLFAEAGWQLGKPLRLVAGARLSLLPERYRITRVEYGGVPEVEVLRPDDQAQLDGRLSLLWTPWSDQVFKLILGTASQDSADASFAELERIRTLELNTTLTRPRGLLSLSLFDNRIENIARSIQRLDGASGQYLSEDDNSGRWHTRGLELIAEARPLPALSLSSSITWQHTEDQANAIDPGYSPELLGKFSLAWQHGPLTLAADGYYVDAMLTDWDFVASSQQGVIERIGESVPGGWDLGVNLRWAPAGRGPYANLRVSNLLDRDIRYPANELTDFERGLIGPGRVITATLGWAFE